MIMKKGPLYSHYVLFMQTPNSRTAPWRCHCACFTTATLVPGSKAMLLNPEYPVLILSQSTLPSQNPCQTSQWAPRYCTFTAAGPTGTFPTHAETHHSPSVPVRNPATLIPSLTPPHSQIPPQVFASYCPTHTGHTRFFPSVLYLATWLLPLPKQPYSGSPWAHASSTSSCSFISKLPITLRHWKSNWPHGSPADILPFSSFLSSDLGVSSTSSGSKGPCPPVLPCSAPPPRWGTSASPFPKSSSPRTCSPSGRAMGSQR